MKSPIAELVDKYIASAHCPNVTETETACAFQPHSKLTGLVQASHHQVE